MRLSPWLAVVGLVVGALALLSDSAASPANLFGFATRVDVVNTTTDEPDSDPGDGICDTGGPTVGGDPACSLRAAIQEANAAPGPHRIDFAIPAADPGHAAGTWTIAPASALPALTDDGTTLDATTQPGYATAPMITVDGSGVGGDGFHLDGDDITLRGLSVGGFGEDGITFAGARGLVAASYVGIAADGATDLGNGDVGVDSLAAASDSTVVGNIVAGNSGAGVAVFGANTTIHGNWIGLAADGSTGLANYVGIYVDQVAVGVTGIGGLDPAAANVISGNTAEGITCDDAGTTIQGNLIGLDATGSAAVGNGGHGIWIRDPTAAAATVVGAATAGGGNVVSGNGADGIRVGAADVVVVGNIVGLDSTGADALPNGDDGIDVRAGAVRTRIGGPGTHDGNVVSGNGGDGLSIEADDVQAIGNLVGLNRLGTGAVGNGDDGIDIADFATDSVIGRSSPGEGNVISGNLEDGIEIGGADARVQGNRIGLPATGAAAIPNGGDGVEVLGAATGVLIGGTTVAESNQISGNAGAGIRSYATTPDDAVLGNRIRGNGKLGIDAGPAGSGDGVSHNDVGDTTGPTNHPEITRATISGGSVTLDFDLDVKAGDYRIEVFANPTDGADPSGYGEGETLVHAQSVTHAGSGAESFTLTGLQAVDADDVLTATATVDLGGGSYGSTSEFSAAVEFDCGDSDGDGLLDCEEDADTDDDNDPSTNPGPDTDGDMLANYLDADDDGDGIPTASENADPNGDGDPRDAFDSDGDGQPDYLDKPTGASTGVVASEQKISDTSGGLAATLKNSDGFGYSVAAIGDLDGDGVVDVAVGADGDDDGGSSRGAVYVLFLRADGTVKGEQKISDTSGGLSATLDNTDWFGTSVGGIGDLDGDGIPDLAVGAEGDDDGGSSRGAVYVLFLRADGTVKGEQKISDISGGLVATLDNDDALGFDVTGIGDLDRDGIPDLAVGAYGDDDGGSSRGAVYVLFLRADGTVKGEQKISDISGGLAAPLDNVDQFGYSVGALRDLDGDGISDLAVGADGDDDGGSSRGAVYVLFLRADGTVKGEQKISDTRGGLTATLDNSDWFGSEVSGVGDLDGDGIVDLIVGVDGDDDGGIDRGAVHVLFLNANGTVKGEQKISDTGGGLAATLDNYDSFGFGAAGIGDLDGDGSIGLIVGAHFDDDGGLDRGAVYVLDLTLKGSTVELRGVGSNTDADVGPSTNPGPDTDGDSTPNYLDADADADDDGDGIPTADEDADPNGDGDPRDALDSDRDRQPDYLDAKTGASTGVVVGEQKISDLKGGLTATLDNSDTFGAAAAAVGDVDGDGIVDLAIGAPFDDDAGTDRGAVYLLFPNGDGTVRAEQKISDSAGGLAETLGNGDVFGTSVSGLGDVDGDGVVDIAVGAEGDDDGGSNRGAVYVLFLNTTGTVRAEQKISNGAAGLALDNSDNFGSSVSGLGDVDGDGVPDLAVGADRDGDAGYNAGAVYVGFLNSDGTVRAGQKITNEVGGLSSSIEAEDFFGVSLSGLGDLDGDGVADLAVGAEGDDDGGDTRGAVYVLFLDTDGTVRTEQKISDTSGGLAAKLDNFDYFGISIAGIGDVDGDGVVDLAVGSEADDDGGTDRGAVYVLFLDTDGTVRAEQKISDTAGGLATTLKNGDWFGSAVSGLGDLDGDGTVGLAVGARRDDDGGTNRGAVYVLDLGSTDASVNSTGNASDASTDDGVCATGATNSEGDPECTLRADELALYGDGTGATLFFQVWDDAPMDQSSIVAASTATDTSLNTWLDLTDTPVTATRPEGGCAGVGRRQPQPRLVARHRPGERLGCPIIGELVSQLAPATRRDLHGRELTGMVTT